MIAYELWIRIGFFLGVLALMAALEHWIPRRKRTVGRKNRWGGNLAIVALNALAVRLIFPLLAIDMALLARSHSWGLLNNYPHFLSFSRSFWCDSFRFLHLSPTRYVSRCPPFLASPSNAPQ